MKLKILAMMFVCVAALSVRAEDQTNTTVAGILKASRWAYATLDSYSDEGTAVMTMGPTPAANYNFTIRLARAGLYHIVWREGDDAFTPKGAVWSAGDGDFLWMGQKFTTRKCENREMAIASATGISGGAAASVPGAFFAMDWGNALGKSESTAVRQADAKIGGTDCFVLFRAENGRTNTLWIGKQDLLIRQIETDTSSDALKAALKQQAAANPQLKASLEMVMAQMTQGLKSVETHNNIIVNTPMKPADFEFQAPAGGKKTDTGGQLQLDTKL